MTLNFPNRPAWLFIGLAILFLLQSGCQPIQPPATVAPAVTRAPDTNEAAARSNLSTNIATETASPDGKWKATTLFQVPREGGEYFQSLVITHTSGSPSYTQVEGWFTLLPGYKLAAPLAWSQDGTRFYYTNRHQPDGCGILYNGSDLYRVDLASGETIELLPADTTIKLGLAPDEKHVAYQAIGEATLIIHNLDRGDTISFDLAPILGDDQMGAIVWSPTSNALAFVVAHKPCSGGWAESTSIYTLDAATLELTPRLEHDARLLRPVAWPDVETLRLEDQAGAHFTLDLTSSEIAPITDQ